MLGAAGRGEGMEQERSGMYDLVLRGGHVIDPAGGVDGAADVGIAGGAIVAVAPGLDTARAKRVVDVAGLYVTPGLIDIHVHVYPHKGPDGPGFQASVDPGFPLLPRRGDDVRRRRHGGGRPLRGLQAALDRHRQDAGAGLRQYRPGQHGRRRAGPRPVRPASGRPASRPNTPTWSSASRRPTTGRASRGTRCTRRGPRSTPPWRPASCATCR